MAEGKHAPEGLSDRSRRAPTLRQRAPQGVRQFVRDTNAARAAINAGLSCSTKHTLTEAFTDADTRSHLPVYTFNLLADCRRLKSDIDCDDQSAQYCHKKNLRERVEEVTHRGLNHSRAFRWLLNTLEATTVSQALTEARRILDSAEPTGQLTQKKQEGEQKELQKETQQATQTQLNNAVRQGRLAVKAAEAANGVKHLSDALESLRQSISKSATLSGCEYCPHTANSFLEKSTDVQINEWAAQCASCRLGKIQQLAKHRVETVDSETFELIYRRVRDPNLDTDRKTDKVKDSPIDRAAFAAQRMEAANYVELVLKAAEKEGEQRTTVRDRTIGGSNDHQRESRSKGQRLVIPFFRMDEADMSGLLTVSSHEEWGSKRSMLDAILDNIESGRHAALVEQVFGIPVKDETSSRPLVLSDLKSG